MVAIISIFERCRTGKKELSQQQVFQSNREMTYHLGRVEHAYGNGPDQNGVENYDETYFAFDSEDGRVLDLLGTKRIS